LRSEEGAEERTGGDKVGEWGKGGKKGKR